MAKKACNQKCNCKLKLGLIFILLGISIVVALVIAAYNSNAKNINTESKFYESVRIGGEWFLNNQNQDFLNYVYYPFEDKYSDEHHALREMGALWSITQLYEFTNDSRYEALAVKGFNYFKQYFKESEKEDFIYVNITPEQIKLGYNAFAILSLIDIEYPNKDELLENLANGILSLQQANGSIRTFFYSVRSTGKDYYPGEALLALMSLYEYNGNQKYLEAVKKAFPYYEKYFNENPNTAFVPWQTRAYYKLYKSTGDKKVRDFIFKMNDYILREYNPKAKCSNFEISGGVAAVHAEGVNMAYDLARDARDKVRATCYKNFSKEVAEYMLTLQLNEDTHFIKRGIGGFLGAAGDNLQRVDRNQHAVMALMDMLEFGILE